MIKVKRVYDKQEKDDGVRVLVDRLWPRGISKSQINVWLKDIAPSNDLRKWFSHDPNKWEEFKSRYFKELNNNPKVKVLVELVKKSENITLLYSTKSPYNNAIALKEYLENLLASNEK
jgi:uncharacterized protein YeaO (DUF488 family)